jgi:hypothetical protein
VGAKVVGPDILGTGEGAGVENVGSIDSGVVVGDRVEFGIVVTFGTLSFPLLSDDFGAVFLPIKYPAAIPTPRNTINSK